MLPPIFWGEHGETRVAPVGGDIRERKRKACGIWRGHYQDIRQTTPKRANLCVNSQHTGGDVHWGVLSIARIGGWVMEV